MKECEEVLNVQVCRNKFYIVGIWDHLRVHDIFVQQGLCDMCLIKSFQLINVISLDADHI